MKKLFAFISILAVCSAAMFADLSAKKLADGSVEVTFFYGNPRASEVLVAGDFTNWQAGALPMTKGDNGFTLVKTFPAGTTVKYKFISDGNWTTDLKAPDFVDDGFGGKNSMADLDGLAGGATGPKAGLKFLTWSMLGAQAKFQTDEDTAQEIDEGLVSAGINLKSYMKVTGTALPNTPIFLEVAVAEQDTFENLYNQDVTEWDDGLQNFFSGLVFAPVYTLNGEKKAGTYLGHFKFGFDSKFVSWTTGYKYAKLPPHSINDWTTVDKEWEAGYEEIGGFNYFELGPALQNLGPVQLKAAFAPNKSADRKGGQYGFFGWVNVWAGNMVNVDFQYNTALGKTFDTIFGHCYEQDFIVGYKGIFGPLTFKASYLANIYGDGDLSRIDGVTYMSKFIPASSDVGEVESDEDGLTNMAFKTSLQYKNDDLGLDVTVGFRFRGKQAGMMYVEEGADDHTNVSDNLGDLNHSRVWLSGTYAVNDWLAVGLGVKATATLDKDQESPFKNEDTVKWGFLPSVAVDLDALAYIPAKVSAYADMSYVTEEEDEKAQGFGTSQFYINAIGVTYDHNFDTNIVKNTKVQYCLDNTDADYMFNTVLSTTNLCNDYGVQLGFGIRTLNPDSEKDDPNNPFGFYVGGFKKLPVLAKPTAYVQFMYAMDPYQKFGDGPTAYRMSADYENATKDGVTDYMDNYAVRLGLQWDL